jgi:hypothetical protein
MPTQLMLGIDERPRGLKCRKPLRDSEIKEAAMMEEPQLRKIFVRG